mgnify:CR=1 FL=1
MKLGNNLKLFFVIFILLINKLLADDKILSSPLINLDNIKPSFEIFDDKSDIKIIEKIKEKKFKNKDTLSNVVLIGIDKITAKSSKIFVNLDESKKFGPLEIKVLRCGKVKVNNLIRDVAYMQVKDLTKSENEKVFIFNGWTFSTDPSLTPFDHAIYDLQLLTCNKV